MAASPEWIDLLNKRGVHPDIVGFLERNKVHCLSDYANYILSRDEIQSGILDAVPAHKDDRTQRMVLHKIWREAEEVERLRVARTAKGVQEDDLEDPVPTGKIDEDIATFASAHRWTPRLSEMLCEPLFARITREIQRRTHTVIPLDRVRAGDETSRRAVGEQIAVSTHLSMRLGAAGVTLGTRDITDNFVALHLVRLLFEGGYAVIGHAIRIDGKPFCTYQECHDYVLDFAQWATPFNAEHPPLHRVLKAHSETHALWAKSMRLGRTLSEAMKDNESKVAALWLFACEGEAQKAARADQTTADMEAAQHRERLRSRSPYRRHSPSPRGRRADDRRRESPRLRSNSRDRRQKHDKGAGKGKSKGNGKGKASSNPQPPLHSQDARGQEYLPRLQCSPVQAEPQPVPSGAAHLQQEA